MVNRKEDHDAASDCKVCPAWRYNDQTGQDGSVNEVCNLCAPGKNIPSINNGQSNMHNGADKCISCAAGTYSQQDRTSCSVCPGGYYNDKSAQEVCEACGAGKFISDSGGLPSKSAHDQESDCKPCQKGTWSNQEYATAPPA